MAHGVGVTLNAYVARQDRRLQVDIRRRRRLVDRPDVAEVAAVRDLVARLGVFEQVAGDWVAAHPASLARAASPGSRSPLMCRLESALAGWDIQAHRTLAAAPDVPDLVRVARVQALIAAATGVVTQAAAHHRVADRGVVQRLTPFLHNAELAWTRSAKRWGDLASSAGRTDPALIRAAGDVQAAIAAAVCTRTGWASPEQLGGRVDLARAVTAFHGASASAVGVAYIAREVAATDRHITTPGRAQLIPLPESVRRGLVTLAEEVVAASGQAVSAAAPLHAGAPVGCPPNPHDTAPPSESPKIAMRGRGLEGPRR